LLLFSIFGMTAQANDSVTLEKGEKIYLIEQVGHTEEEIEQLPIEVAKMLVEEQAIIEDTGSEIFDFVEQLPSKSYQITPFGKITSSEMKLGATAYKVTSDRANDDKFYIYANFEWLTHPLYVLVDKMTFGFPSSSHLYLPTSGENVVQHEHRYSHDPQGNGNWINYSIIKKPFDWEPNAGVAGAFDLRAGGGSKAKHKGYMGQYVYVPKSKNGTTNIKVEYGHKRISGTPNLSIFPTGIGITPSSTVDTASYGLTISY